MPGELVADIRCRAWFALSALHLIIGVHSPLVIKIVDSRNGRSIRGVTFRESLPGGATVILSA